MRWLLAFLLLVVAQAHAQYPARAVRIVVPFPAGGPTDVLARVVAQKLSTHWAQPVVVENKPGAGGAIGADFVAKSPPDGYTLVMATSSTHSIGPVLQKLPYDAQTDFAPVVHAWSAPNALIVSPVLGVDDVRGLVAFIFDSIITAQQHARAGSVKLLAVSTAKRSALVPDVPTMSEAGVQGYESTTWFGLLGPAATPRQIIGKVNSDVGALLKEADVRERFAAAGAEPIGGSPEAFAATIAAERAKWAKVVQAAKIKVD